MRFGSRPVAGGHSEQAMYEASAQVAAAAGDRETEQLARDIQQEEARGGREALALRWADRPGGLPAGGDDVRLDARGVGRSIPQGCGEGYDSARWPP